MSDISVEALLNQSTVGTGVNKKLATVVIDSMGTGSNRAALAVTDTAQEITLTAGCRTIWLQNSGSNDIQIGGSGVLTTTGVTIFTDQTMIFNNVKDDFSIYVITVAGGSELRIVEFT